ncbi:MAG: DEAD/DEAH box helicase [Thermoanaerobaculia bacterium]
MVRIPRSLERLAAPEIRSRGESYFLRKTVQLLEADAFTLAAEVRGTDVYRVCVRQRAGIAYYFCACPYFAREVDFCKHLWAVLATVASRRGLEDWPARAERWTAAPELEDGELAAETDDAIESALPRVEVSELPPPGPTRLERPAAGERSWRTEIARIGQRAAYSRSHSAEGPSAAARELLYVLRTLPGREDRRLRLTCEVRSPGKDGGWGKRTHLRLERHAVPALSENADREILGMLAGAQAADTYGGGFDSWRRDFLPHSYDLEPFQVAALLPALCASGRLRAEIVAADGSKQLGPAIAWRPEPWRLRLRLERSALPAAPPAAAVRGPETADYHVTSELWQGERRLEAADRLLWILPGGTLLAAEWASPFDDGGTPEWLELALPGGELLVPAGEVEAWLEAVHRLPRVPELSLPPEWALAEGAGEARPRLSISAPEALQPWGQRKAVLLELSFTYEDVRLDARDTRPWILEIDRRRRIRRSASAEATAAGRLFELGARAVPSYRASGETRLELTPAAVPDFVRQLLAEGWEVEAESRAFRPPGKASFSLSSGLDWFDLEGGIEFGDEKVPLPKLLQAMRAGKGMVELGDGSWGLLPEAWLVNNALMGDVGEVSGASVRLSRPQAMFVDSWLQGDALAEVVADPPFERWRRELAAFSGIRPIDAPKGFRGELRGYQREGLGWLLFLERFGFGGCLADDMGLGKTVQILALLAGRRARRARRSPGAPGAPGVSGAAAATGARGRQPSLVVVPRSLLYNWREEAARFAPRLRILELHGAERRSDPATLAEFDLVLTTYGTLKRDIDLLAVIEFDYCILDEAQTIKNSTTAAARAVRRVRARHRLVATGTPIENHLGELWSLFEFLNPGLLGRLSNFRGVNGAARKIAPETRERLALALRPFLLRRTKQEVAPELPQKTEQTVLCELDGAQRRLYDELRDHYRRSLAAKVARQGWAKSKIQVLEALLRLRQAACHPGLLDPRRTGDESAKFEALLPRLEEIVEEGSKALVFSQFTSLLALLEKRLDAKGWTYEYLDGATTDRQARVERFQSDPACPLFLISLKAGGLGLNLTAAEYVFLLDPWWNPAVEAQAIDRAHRIGQNRPVFAYRLIAENTVEQKILELQAEKRELADALLGGDAAPLASLTRDDFELLLG